MDEFFANPIEYYAPILELPQNTVQGAENVTKTGLNASLAFMDSLTGTGRDGFAE